MGDEFSWGEVNSTIAFTEEIRFPMNITILNIFFMTFKPSLIFLLFSS